MGYKEDLLSFYLFGGSGWGCQLCLQASPGGIVVLGPAHEGELSAENGSGCRHFRRESDFFAFRGDKAPHTFSLWLHACQDW